MKSLFTLLVFLGVLTSGTAIHASTNHHVVIISIDGFAAFHLENPKAPVPNLRKLAASGVTAKGLKVSTPAVTWPNHTTIATGVKPEKHSVLFNGMVVRPGNEKPLFIDGYRDKTDLVKAATLYDVLHKRGYRTSAINWPCTRNAATLDDNFPDVPQMIQYSTPRLIEELVRDGVMKSGTDLWFATQSSQNRDDIWTAAACNSIKRLKPNFMMFHLLLADGVQHRTGPGSAETMEALAHTDKNLQKVLDAIDAAGIRENTTIFVVADHGFFTVERTIHGNAILKEAGLLEIGENDAITRAQVQIIPEGGTAFLYFNSAESKKANEAKVVALFEKQEGVAQIIRPADYKKYGLPNPDTNQQSPDLVLVGADGYAFGKGVTEAVVKSERPIGTHGHLDDNPKMNAIFVAAGRGIQSGKTIGVVENIDIAPTAAFLLGEKFPSADGRVLKEILVK